MAGPDDPRISNLKLEGFSQRERDIFIRGFFALDAAAQDVILNNPPTYVLGAQGGGFTSNGKAMIDTRALNPRSRGLDALSGGIFGTGIAHALQDAIDPY